MELNSQINTFTKGMNLDTDITMIPEGQYRYAENIRLLTDADGTTGMLQNIEYIRQYTDGIPSDETILGTATARLHKDEGNGTYECGIVLTKKLDEDKKTINTLYKVTGFESISLTFTVILSGYLNIENNVSIVTNYESDYVSNVYICDGLTPIKVINIYDTHPTDPKDLVDATRYDITPGCVLLPFVFQNTIGGALPAGSIQYCYQLFNQHGPETTTSALSEVIPITKYDRAGSSSKVIGQLKGELSDRGCQIKASFLNDGRFDRARIFSIVYLDNISVPDIYIINEIEIPNSGNEFTEFTYNDTGASFLSKITIDEFNALVPFEFNAKCVEKMGNRLYAANVQELTWDVDYDARAYRCNWNGDIVLTSSDASKTISGTLNEDGTITSNSSQVVNGLVAKEHDCINMFNTMVYDVLGNTDDTKYIYQSRHGVRGGIGPNVSYRFICTELVPSSVSATTGIVDSLNLNAQPIESNQLYVYYDDGNLKDIHTIQDGNLRKIIPNYADPYICANFLGYQRDEIYRFGIIFYNNKNIPSPVHWIGDIRMPSTRDGRLTDKIHPFHNSTIARCYNNETKEMVCYALGIEFTVKNIPAGVMSYEIVRCDRNEKDRTIITQGILGALFSFEDWDQKKLYAGQNDMRPAPMFNLASSFRTYYRSGDSNENDYNDKHKAVPGYFEFVSPEICISKDTILQNIQGNGIAPLYDVDSVCYSSILIDESKNTYESTNRVSVPQDQLLTVSTAAEGGHGLNDRYFGTLNEDTSYHKGLVYLDMGKGHRTDGLGYAGVFKYYNKQLSNYAGQYINIEDGIISQTLPYFMSLKDAKGYGQPIGNKLYVNFTAGGRRQVSNHGVSAVLQLDESFNPHKDPTQLRDFCTAIIANVKQSVIPYGGNTYISRQNSVYNSCGCFSSVQDNKPLMCYGGDTYLGILDYLNTSIVQHSNDVEDDDHARLCCVCYIPLETSVNLNLRSDESYHRTASDKQGNNFVQSEPTVLPNGYTQKKPYYEYNPVYSATSGSKQYVSKSIYSVDNQINQNRIVVSELKTNNEITDSWTKFKFANYLDVDSQYGQITNLKEFNNKLFYWQDSAVGTAAVNERVLVTDDNMAKVTLGVGGILARYDYISTLNGSSIVNDKSITDSATTIYWYDFDKNEICALTNGVELLSKICNVQSYLNTLSKSSKQNAVSFYDKKYNEVWFRIYDKALIYNEQLKVFTSFYTHNPNWFFPFSDKLVTIKDNNMYYLHNIYEVNSEIKEERTSKVEFVVNKDISNTKVFDNVVFSADLLDTDNDVPNIVKNVIFKTKTQETNPIDFKNIELREDNYRFPISREKAPEALNNLASQSYLGRMRGKYLICDYTFDCNNNREFKLPYIKTTYRYSML